MWSAQFDGLWFVCRQGQKIYLLSKTARQAMGPTYHPLKWLPEFFSGGKAVHHMLRLSMSGASTSTPPLCLTGVGTENIIFTFVYCW